MASLQERKSYYNFLYPARIVYDWLVASQANGNVIGHREFAFRLESGAMKRFLHFGNHIEFKRSVLKENPEAVDFGGLYRKPCRLASDHGEICARELVIDIDINDYPARTCCKNESKICPSCWGFLALAVKIIDRTVREDFGYKLLLWVYSGRRGIHLWISDTEAMYLSDQERRAFVYRLNGFRRSRSGAEWSTWRMNGGFDVRSGDGEEKMSTAEKLFRRMSVPIEFSFRGALEIISPHFQQIMLEQQDFLRHTGGELEVSGNEEPISHLNDVLGMVVQGFRGSGDWTCHRRLKRFWEDKTKSSVERWAFLLQLIADLRQSADKPDHKKRMAWADVLQSCVDEIQLFYLYPRLDVQVSRFRNHLLKSPFAAHKATGHVCLPLDPQRLILNVPPVLTVQEALSQVDAAFKLEEEQPAVRLREGKWEMTDMAQGVNYMKRLTEKILMGG